MKKSENVHNQSEYSPANIPMFDKFSNGITEKLGEQCAQSVEIFTSEYADVRRIIRRIRGPKGFDFLFKHGLLQTLFKNPQSSRGQQRELENFTDISKLSNLHTEFLIDSRETKERSKSTEDDFTKKGSDIRLC
ncbi:hypothetical protein LINGRAHAP2_LOCUS2191 [Linum grandiflorum]